MWTWDPSECFHFKATGANNVKCNLNVRIIDPLILHFSFLRPLAQEELKNTSTFNIYAILLRIGYSYATKFHIFLCCIIKLHVGC